VTEERRESVITSGDGSLITQEALRDEQSVRNRVGLGVTFWTALLGTIVLQITEKKTLAHWALTGAVALLTLSCGAFWYEARDGRPVHHSRMLITGVLIVVVTLACSAHFGLLSPIVVILFVLIEYNANVDFKYNAPVIYALSAIGTAVLAVCSYLGFLPLTDSVLALTKQNNRALIGFTVLIESLLFASYRMNRQMREGTRQAMQRLERAQQQIHQRDALLLEARADLDRVHDAARIGRFTEREVGPYTAGEVIGRGATGDVYHAVEKESGEVVALKVLHPHLLEESSMVERFMREADLAGRLDSPHLVKIRGTGKTTDGSPYIAMEFLRGEDLSALLRREKTLELPGVLEMVAQIARGLSVAQESGIVHRDLKPQNVFLAKSGEGGKVWKLLDFGVAAFAHGSGELTRGAAVGTPNYMSPEQAQGKSVDHRSDVFSLGVIAYRALTGRPAFTAQNQTATMFHVSRTQPQRPGALANLPEDVDFVFAIALAKTPEKRFSSANTFAAAFRDASRGELDEPHREAARHILGVHPWGREIPR
jgi:serine/threonine-protein kinase